MAIKGRSTPTGETVTPSIEMGTSRAAALASAPVPTVDVERAHIYTQSITVSIRFRPFFLSFFLKEMKQIWETNR